MWATMITIKRTKDLNYFSLRALNLFNTEFHNLSWITETNELLHDILIYWDEWDEWIMHLYKCICLGYFFVVSSTLDILFGVMILNVQLRPSHFETIC